MAEIGIAGFNFAPKNFAQCNGQFLPINQNQALFALLGTRYGGNGQTTFALPDLRGRVPIHMGNGWTQGQMGGQEFHTITQSEMPEHVHFANATTDTATANQPTNALMLAVSTPQSLYASATNFQAMAPGAISNIGGSQAHENRQPYLVLNFCICLIGIFPSQN